MYIECFSFFSPKNFTHKIAKRMNIKARLYIIRVYGKEYCENQRKKALQKEARVSTSFTYLYLPINV